MLAEDIRLPEKHPLFSKRGRKKYKRHKERKRGRDEIARLFARPTRLLPPLDSPGKSTGVGCHFLLQRIFPTQGSNPDLLNSRQML